MTHQVIHIPFSNLGELVDHAARKYGQRLLWQSLDDSSTLSFSDIAAESLAFARALRDIGVRQGDHIAVMLPSVTAFAITWAAIARLGAVIVPINYQYTSGELGYVLKDSDSSFLIIDGDRADLLAQLTPHPIPEINIILHGAPDTRFQHNWHEMLRSTPVSPLDMPQVKPDDLMSIQYTSGTTGFPKGCMLTHDYWLVLGAVRAIQMNNPKRMLLDKPLSYMGGIWRLLVCLYIGTTAYVAHKFTLSGMQQRIVDNQIDLFSVTDPVAKLPLHPGIHGMKFSCITASGLSKEAHVAIEKKFGGPVREMYGMTEIGSTIYMPTEDATMSGSGSCGKPAPFRECRIVDPSGKDVGPGQSGELWVRGRAIFQGYYNKEEATRDAFHDDWFRTGDLFRQDERGYFYIIGRIKDSIRRSGENISSHEVASVVSALSGVMEAAAIGVPDDFRGEEVKVLIVLQAGTSRHDVSPEYVIAHCQNKLAAFKVPRYIQYVPDFPRTSSGKIAINSIKSDQALLQAPVFDRTKNTWI